MSSQHPSVPAQDYNRFTASLEKTGDGTIVGDMHSANVSGSNPVLMTPPPAHSHLKLKRSVIPSSTSTLHQSHQKQLLQNLPANLLALLPPGLIESASLDSQIDNTSAPGCSFSFPYENQAGLTAAASGNNDDQPLDFSSTGRSKLDSELSVSDQIGKQKKKKTQSSHATENIYEDDDDEAVMSPEEVDVPIDLSMSRMPRQPVHQSSSPGMKAVTLAQAQAIPPNKVEELYGVALRVWLAKTLRHP